MAVLIENAGIEAPGLNTSLWRYMSLSKFLQLLQTQSLWFTRVDQLIATDPYEGSLPFAYDKSSGDTANRDAIREKKLQLQPGSSALMRENMIATFKNNRTSTFVSCWHGSRTDNDAMWRLYGAEKDGSICVQTTVGRVMDLLPDWVSLGRITYTSYEESWNVPLNAYTPFFRKRLCFEHEKEIRLLVNSDLDDLPPHLLSAGSGLTVPVDPEALFLRVYVSPTAPAWFESVVAGIIKEMRLRIPVSPAPMSRQAFL